MSEDEKQENKSNDLESEVNFSWGRVVKRGIQNMKDDLDPVYKGAKMGAYALHGIPTWAREYKEGKLSSDSHGWSFVSGMFVGGASVTAYILGTMEAVAAVGSGGYAVLAVPLAAQGLSYTREAFRRARKTELENVVMTKVQRTLNKKGSEGYDLTCEEMIDDYNSAINDQYHPNVRKVMEEENVNYGREALSSFTSRLFDELFADNKVGKQYELDAATLSTGPKRREAERDHKKYGGSEKFYGDFQKLAEIIYDTVEQNGGTANIEMLGQVTIVYSKKGNRPYYKVTPNEVWKK